MPHAARAKVWPVRTRTHAQHPTSAEIVRDARRRGRRVVCGRARQPGRTAGSERRRQDHDRFDDRRARRAGERRRAGRGRAPERRHRSEETPHRPRAAGSRALRRARRRARTCASSARSTACRARRSTRRSRTRWISSGLADRVERSRLDLQRRHEAAVEPGGRAAARSRRAPARRADGRRRSAEPQRDLRQPRDAQGARQGAASTRRTTWKKSSGSPIASSSWTTAR